MANKYNRATTPHAPRPDLKPEGITMTDNQIAYLVQRFLLWQLPDDFSPDAGISFTPDFNVGTAYPMRHRPSGTNLLNADQAKDMVRHMLDGMPIQ